MTEQQTEAEIQIQLALLRSAEHAADDSLLRPQSREQYMMEAVYYPLGGEPEPPSDPLEQRWYYLQLAHDRVKRAIDASGRWDESRIRYERGDPPLLHIACDPWDGMYPPLQEPSSGHFDKRPKFWREIDGWSMGHRNLGPGFYMTDVDGLLAQLGDGTIYVHSEHVAFAEYVHGPGRHDSGLLPDIAYLSFFDRKKTRPPSDVIASSTQVYLDLCRKLRKDQPVRPRFFWVWDDLKSGWWMEEVNPIDGIRSSKPVYLPENGPWLPIWQSLGLVDDRQRLAQWMKLRGSK